MAKFFVGQRVRVVRDLLGLTPHTLGRESVINGIDDLDKTFMKPWEFRLKEFPGLWFHADELEPILDLNEPCDAEFKESLDKLLDGLPA